MNILFLNSARSWGGNENWTHLAAGTLSGKHVVHLAYRSEVIGRRFTVPRHRLPFLNEVDPVSILGLAALIKNHQFDVLIPTKRKDYVLAGLAARLKGVKNILRIGIVRRLKNNYINRLVYSRLCHGIIVNSEAIRTGLSESGAAMPDTIRVIHNGVPLETIQSKAMEKNGYQKPFEFMISSLGEISDRKGVDSLVRSFGQFLEQSGDRDRYGLALIGGGESQSVRNLIRNLDIEAHVVLTGFQENPYPFVRQSDLFVMASRNEGIPNAMLEAMALRIPVISTHFEGVDELIQDDVNGFIVAPGDENALSAKIQALTLDAKKRLKVCESAYETVQNRFNLENMGREIEGLCQEILAQTG